MSINNTYALVQAAIAGAGLANLSAYVAADALSKGLVKTVLSDYESPGPTVWLVYLERRHLSPRVQALATLLTENIPTRVA